MLMDAIKKMSELKNRIDSMKEEMKDLNKEYDRLRLEEIPSLMEDQGIERLSVDSVGTIYLTSDLYASIPAAGREGAYEWLGDHGYGDLVTQTVNASTLKAFVKGAIERGEELPDELFKVSPFTRAAIRK
jgi:hypothetical protein